jgi:hypothetical protein
MGCSEKSERCGTARAKAAFNLRGDGGKKHDGKQIILHWNIIYQRYAAPYTPGSQRDCGIFNPA